MVCRTIYDNEGKAIGISCTRGESSKCSKCGARSTKLCDFPLTGHLKGQTCDRKLCARCAVKMGPNRDFCPAHAELHAKRGTEQPAPSLRDRFTIEDDT
jgi:hypothetical protein